MRIPRVHGPLRAAPPTLFIFSLAKSAQKKHVLHAGGRLRKLDPHTLRNVRVVPLVHVAEEGPVLARHPLVLGSSRVEEDVLHELLEHLGKERGPGTQSPTRHEDGIIPPHARTLRQRSTAIDFLKVHRTLKADILALFL